MCIFGAHEGVELVHENNQAPVQACLQVSPERSIGVVRTDLPRSAWACETRCSSMGEFFHTLCTRPGKRPGSSDDAPEWSLSDSTALHVVPTNANKMRCADAAPPTSTSKHPIDWGLRRSPSPTSRR